MDVSPKWVFTFGAGHADGTAAQRNLLGGKGAYLAEMSRLGLPVPPGLTISSEVCAAYYASDHALPEALKPMVSEALNVVGEVAGARFGDVVNPLLVSVRSGSRASMPGMMDTILNLGLNDKTVEGLATRSKAVSSRTRSSSNSGTKAAMSPEALEMTTTGRSVDRKLKLVKYWM